MTDDSNSAAGAAARGEITRLLVAHRGGDRGAFDQLVALVHGELSIMAKQRLRAARPGQGLDTVALVNEAYLRLVEDAQVDWQNRAHFFGVVSRAMRWIVVDHARSASAARRGGGEAEVPLDTGLVGFSQPAETVLAIHAALEQLEALNPRLARLVECRYFVGMTEEEIAEALAVSVRTVQREWLKARAWLQRFLAPTS